MVEAAEAKAFAAPSVTLNPPLVRAEEVEALARECSSANHVALLLSSTGTSQLPLAVVEVLAAGALVGSFAAAAGVSIGSVGAGWLLNPNPNLQETYPEIRSLS